MTRVFATPLTLILLPSLILLSCLFTHSTYGQQVFKCEQEDGSIVFSDKPCSQSAETMYLDERQSAGIMSKESSANLVNDFGYQDDYQQDYEASIRQQERDFAREQNKINRRYDELIDDLDKRRRKGDFVGNYSRSLMEIEQARNLALNQATNSIGIDAKQKSRINRTYDQMQDDLNKRSRQGDFVGNRSRTSLEIERQRNAALTGTSIEPLPLPSPPPPKKTKYRQTVNWNGETYHWNGSGYTDSEGNFCPTSAGGADCYDSFIPSGVLKDD